MVNNSRKTIGLVGYGIVNRAVGNAFKKYYTIFVYDKPKQMGDVKEVTKCDFIFIAVPTPTDKSTGSIDLTILNNVIEELSQYVDKGYQVIIVKSSIVPGTMNHYAMKYPDIKFVYNPEFLTEKNSLYDFLHQDRIVIASNHFKQAYEVGALYRHIFPDTTILYTDFAEAEMIKYASNCFLATKVTYANEIYRICKAFGIDYEKVKQGVSMDKRIGFWGWQVPGENHEFGFGKFCLPKDIQALITHCEEKGYTPEILKAVWDNNLRYRKNYDWRKIEGAVVKGERICVVA